MILFNEIENVKYSIPLTKNHKNKFFLTTMFVALAFPWKDNNIHIIQ